MLLRAETTAEAVTEGQNGIREATAPKAPGGLPEEGLRRLLADAEVLGQDIVEIAAFLDQVEDAATAQVAELDRVRSGAQAVSRANAAAAQSAEELSAVADATLSTVSAAVGTLQASGQRAREIAAWVEEFDQRLSDVETALAGIAKENGQIADIAGQVNILAINAKIEAARAGDAGRGFAVVAEAINELSHRTATTAGAITTAVRELTGRIAELKRNAGRVSAEASAVRSEAAASDRAMERISEALGATREGARDIAERSVEVARGVTAFEPAVERIAEGGAENAEAVHEARARVAALVDRGEAIVQQTVALGGQSADARLIELVRHTAGQMGAALDGALQRGEITLERLFVRRYEPVAGSDPAQVMAPFTALTDRLFPALQEPVLAADPRVVFCAAVDRNGYLPTHNRKFSAPQGRDPVWNAANCRNRRIFDDRVSLKAGNSTAPFLLQVYRRDMGGGKFVMMKDLSAPIMVAGRLWGGLRLAYGFAR